MSSFSVLLASPGATSWLFIEFLFLDFHIAHIVIDIRIRSLSESFGRVFLLLIHCERLSLFLILSCC